MTTKETKIGGIHSAFFFMMDKKEPTQSVGFCCELVNNKTIRINKNALEKIAEALDIKDINLIIQFEDDNNE